jgi:hypothetical protein
VPIPSGQTPLAGQSYAQTNPDGTAENQDAIDENGADQRPPASPTAENPLRFEGNQQ